MPSERSNRVAYRRYLRNRSSRSALRTARTKAEQALETGAPEEAGQLVVGAIRLVDRAARKGIVHRNKAARQKSRLSRKLNAVQPKQD